MTRPQWTSEGEPANDAGAMADALEWLEVLAQLKVVWRSPRQSEARERLGRCIAELRKRVEVVEEAETTK